MKQDLVITLALLEKTPAALDALLRGLPDQWTHSNEGEGSWSVFEVIGHLIHADREDWMPRVRTILEFGENGAFPPFDRMGYVRTSAGKTLPELLDEFSQTRNEQLSELKSLNLSSVDLERTGQHPAFGKVALSQLLATWAAHDLTHLHQISRVMSYQYREAVGPWIKYLGVMQCAGHSS